MVKCSEEGEENARVDDSLAQIGGDDVCEVFPARVVEAQGHDEQISDEHQAGSGAHEVGQFAPARHHDASDETPERCCEGWDDQAGACPCGTVKQDYLEKQWEGEEKLKTVRSTCYPAYA